jgi:hypothetical protein
VKDNLNEVLRQAYTSFNSAVDRIAASAALRNAFRTRLPSEFQHIEDDELVRRLLNLRKRGKLSRTRAQRA